MSIHKMHKNQTSLLFQSKDDDEQLDPTYTPLAVEMKQKKFEDNETLMLVMVS